MLLQFNYKLNCNDKLSINILNLLILIPILTVTGIVFAKGMKAVRVTAAIGMFLQLITAILVLFTYMAIRKSGVTDEMVMMSDHMWFPSLNIHYAIGIDGISAAMILLTAIVVFAGIFASWQVEYLQKEFFISLILLATGVFGFFISIDLFTMFLYYEIAVIPMYLLIGIWGSGPKAYSFRSHDMQPLSKPTMVNVTPMPMAVSRLRLTPKNTHSPR